MSAGPVELREWIIYNAHTVFYFLRTALIFTEQ